MKFIFYKGDQKITIDNVFVPHADNLDLLLNSKSENTMDYADMDIGKMKITSTRGMFLDHEEVSDEEIEEEIFEGINFHHETVN